MEGYFEKGRCRLSVDFGTPDGFSKGVWKQSKANWLFTAVPVILMLQEKFLI